MSRTESPHSDRPVARLEDLHRLGVVEQRSARELVVVTCVVKQRQRWTKLQGEWWEQRAAWWPDEPEPV